MMLCVSCLPGKYPATMGNAEICHRVLVLLMCLKREVHQGERFRREPCHQSHDILGVIGQELSF